MVNWKLSLFLVWLVLPGGCSTPDQGADSGVSEDAGLEPDGAGDTEADGAGDTEADGAGDPGMGTDDGGAADAADDQEPLLDPDQAGPGSWSQSQFDLDLADPHVGTTIPLVLYIPDAPGTKPVVVFLHGFQLSPSDYASYGEHLASWGHVVVMPQMPGGLVNGPTHRELKEYLIAIVDWIEQDATDPAGQLQGRADAGALGLSGHSMGGKISLLVASEDARPKASFAVDPVDAAGGPLAGDPVDFPSVTPELMPSIQIPLGFVGETVNATCTGWMCQACAPEDNNFHQYYLHAQSPAIEIELSGANHMSFLDDPNCGLPCSMCAQGTDDPAVTRRLTRGAMTAFYLVFLQGRSEYLEYLTGSPMQQDAAQGLLTFDSKNGF